MKLPIKFSDLWRWDGPLDRGPYILWGIILFTIKHNLDRLVAACFFHRYWLPTYYLFPDQSYIPAFTPASLSNKNIIFYGTLLALALPFIWSGTVLTLRRLRSIGLSPYWVLLFFSPCINVLFFSIISILPPKLQEEDSAQVSVPEGKLKRLLDRMIPDNIPGSVFIALIVLSFGLLIVSFSVNTLQYFGV